MITRLIVFILFVVQMGLAQEVVYVKGGVYRPFMNIDQGRDQKKTFQVVDFYIDKYPVTIDDFVDFLNHLQPSPSLLDSISCGQLPNGIIFDDQAKKYLTKEGNERIPVEAVSWYGAKIFSEWKGGRLPSGLEWEYAANGGNETIKFEFSGSDNADEVAIYKKKNAQVVGQKKPNELGIYDMTGNVWEWTTTNKDNLIYKEYETFLKRDAYEIRGGSWRELQTLFLRI